MKMLNYKCNRCGRLISPVIIISSSIVADVPKWRCEHCNLTSVSITASSIAAKYLHYLHAVKDDGRDQVTYDYAASRVYLEDSSDNSNW